MVKNYHIQVLGIVQGVWFRKYTKESADIFSLNGYVKNESDGSVYIEVEGGEEDLNKFVKWLSKGSPLSKVRQVIVTESRLTHYSGFQVTG
jgi:acylphosphatase